MDRCIDVRGLAYVPVIVIVYFRASGHWRETRPAESVHLDNVIRTVSIYLGAFAGAGDGGGRLIVSLCVCVCLFVCLFVCLRPWCLCVFLCTLFDGNGGLSDTGLRGGGLRRAFFTPFHFPEKEPQ